MDKIWSQEEEARRLRERFDALKEDQGIGQAQFARDYQIRGGASMVSQHIWGRRPMNLEAATAYATGFNCKLEEISPRLARDVALAARRLPDSRAQPLAPLRDKAERAFWPFSAISEEELSALPESTRNRLDGALSLALAQINQDKRGKTSASLPSIPTFDDPEDPFPMMPTAPKPWEPGWKPEAQPERVPVPSISTVRDVVANVSAGGHASNDEFEPVPELPDVRLSAGDGLEVFNEAADGVLHFRASFLRQHNADGGRGRVVYAAGDSMEPVIQDGAAMLLVPAPGLTLRDVAGGGVWAINYGGKMLVKTIARQLNDAWVARSFNRSYPDILLNGDVNVQVLGRIVWAGAALPPDIQGQW